MSLVTLAEVKTFLQITTTTSDALLTLYIDYVGAEIDAYTGRTLSQTVYTDEVLEYVESDYDYYSPRALAISSDFPVVFTKEFPISGLGLTYNGESVDTENYNYIPNTGVITLYKKYLADKQLFKATYTAGYTIVTGTSYSVPTDLKLVTLEGVKRMYENNTAANTSGGNVKSKRIKDFNVEYGNDQTGYVSTLQTNGNTRLMKSYLAANAVILDRYRKIFI